MNKPLVRQLTALAASAVCSLAMILAVPAAEAAGNTPKDIVEDMGFGWNLGNSLDAHNNDLSPTTYTNGGLDTETAWGNPKVTKELVDAVKAKGFKTIRIPTTWSNHVTDSSYTIDPEWMSRVKEVVDYAYSQDMYVILNVHHEQWNDPSSDNLENGKKVMALIWKQIAEKFKAYGDHLIFEGQNEPRLYNGGDSEWWTRDETVLNNVNILNGVFVETVRATGGNNSSRMLMLPTYAASIDHPMIDNWQNTTDDPNVIVSLHAYSPYEFAMKEGGDYTDTWKNKLADIFNAIGSNFLDKGYSVVIGEFSASDRNNTDARISWAADYAGHINSLNDKYSNAAISAVLWDNNSNSTGDDQSEFHGYLNRTTLKWRAANTPVLNTLFKALTGTDAPTDNDEDPAEILDTSKFRKDGSVSITENTSEGAGSWWEQIDITKSQILLNGQVNEADVKSVTFFGTDANAIFVFSGDNSFKDQEYYTVDIDDLTDTFAMAVSRTPGTYNIYWQLNYTVSSTYEKVSDDGSKGEYGYCKEYDMYGNTDCIYIVYKLNVTEEQLKDYSYIAVISKKGNVIAKSKTDTVYEKIDFSDAEDGSDVLNGNGQFLFCWKLDRHTYPAGVTVTAKEA